MGLDGGLPDLSKLVEPMQLEVPSIKLRFDQVNVKYLMTPDGNETQIQFMHPNPMFPIVMEFPFQPVYLERHIDNLQQLLERAREVQAKGT